jgi:hypothetical protein
MKTFKPSILTSALLAVGALNGQTTGSVAGTVLENGAVPLSGATVSYMGTGRPSMGRDGITRYSPPQVTGIVQARADGTFSIIGLPQGRYTICASGTLPIHISSCAWNTADPHVSIAPGQNLTGLRLSVARGALLNITLADSTGCAAKYSRAPVYVFSGSLSQGASRVSTTAGAYKYQAVVPQSTPLRVTANHRCSFADASGYALSADGLSIPAIEGESASATMTAK